MHGASDYSGRVPEHSIDTAVTADPLADQPVEARQRRSRRVRRTDWRLGSSTVARWREMLLAIALFSVGCGFLAGVGAMQLGLGSTVATALIWVGMLVPVVIAFARSRPIGLLKFRAVDLVWALGLGLILRTLQGWAAGADGVAAPFPTLTTVDGKLGNGWWFSDAIAPVIVAPLIETFFFQGVLLVALFTVLRRPLGSFTAGLTAWLITTGLFVLAHTATGGADVAAVVAVAALGATCGLLVLLTGRIWGAVLTHAVFNASGVVLALAGTFLT